MRLLVACLMICGSFVMGYAQESTQGTEEVAVEVSTAPASDAEVASNDEVTQ